MHRLWLIFAQAATIAVAALFVCRPSGPEWLPSRIASQVAVVQQAPTTGPLPTRSARRARITTRCSAPRLRW